ncbi:hypothetical protein [Pseudomonas serbica]|uniref:hypothetical protein n=1 Tax=Pseudomonas serbica TaxID=2965074 RepID=UPI00237A79E0|nr:hypothetical protein [Pseudomonas serbica]
MANEQFASVTFDDLALEDTVVIQDHGHNAHGARGKVYFLDADTQLVSVVTNGCVDTWEGYADGLQKLVA